MKKILEAVNGQKDVNLRIDIIQDNENDCCDLFVCDYLCKILKARYENIKLSDA